MKHTLFFLLSIFIFMGCNDENPLLINPPAKSETVKVRFINFSLDKQNRTLDFTGLKIENIAYNSSSEAIKPPSDSVYLKVLKNNALEFAMTNQIKYIRNTNYSFITINSTNCINCTNDTIIQIRTSSAVPENDKQSLIKFANFFPDTNFRYLIKYGCPSGDDMFAPIGFLQYSIEPKIIEIGTQTISLIKVPKDKPNEKYLVNLYQLDIPIKSQYTIILNNLDNKENLQILNENDFTSNSLTPLPIVKERNTSIRTINLSSENIDLSSHDTKFATNIQPNYIDDFRNFEVCNSLFKDTIDVSNSGKIFKKVSTSLKVNTKYSLIVFDSSVSNASNAIIIEDNVHIASNDKSYIRVVNAAEYNFPITVALGARFSENDHNKYTSGTTLATKLHFGYNSKEIELASGVIPINVFTGNEPAQLLFSTLTTVHPNKNYLLIMTTDKNKQLKLILVDDDDKNMNFNFLEKGVFVQLLNAVKNKDIKVSFEAQSGTNRLLQDAVINFTNSIATVIENKKQDLIINGKSFSFIPEEDKRTTIIVASDNDEIKIMSENSIPDIKGDLVKYRFINTTNIPLINISKDANPTSYVEAVESFKSSAYIIDNRDRKITYYLFDGENKKYFNRINDIYFTLGKSYSIIIGGYPSDNCIKEFDASRPNDIPNCYFVIINQEF